MQTSVIINMPAFHFLKRNKLDIDLDIAIALLNPLPQRFGAIDGIFSCK